MLPTKKWKVGTPLVKFIIQKSRQKDVIALYSYVFSCSHSSLYSKSNIYSTLIKSVDFQSDSKRWTTLLQLFPANNQRTSSFHHEKGKCISSLPQEKSLSKREVQDFPWKDFTNFSIIPPVQSLQTMNSSISFFQKNEQYDKHHTTTFKRTYKKDEQEYCGFGNRNKNSSRGYHSHFGYSSFFLWMIMDFLGDLKLTYVLSASCGSFTAQLLQDEEFLDSFQEQYNHWIGILKTQFQLMNQNFYQVEKLKVIEEKVNFAETRKELQVHQGREDRGHTENKSRTQHSRSLKSRRICDVLVSPPLIFDRSKDNDEFTRGNLPILSNLSLHSNQKLSHYISFHTKNTLKSVLLSLPQDYQKRTFHNATFHKDKEFEQYHFQSISSLDTMPVNLLSKCTIDGVPLHLPSQHQLSSLNTLPNHLSSWFLQPEGPSPGISLKSNDMKFNIPRPFIRQNTKVIMKECAADTKKFKRYSSCPVLTLPSPPHTPIYTKSKLHPITIDLDKEPHSIQNFKTKTSPPCHVSQNFLKKEDSKRKPTLNKTFQLDEKLKTFLESYHTEHIYRLGISLLKRSTASSKKAYDSEKRFSYSKTRRDAHVHSKNSNLKRKSNSINDKRQYAMELLEQAAHANHAPANFALGLIYHFGKFGVEINMLMAVSYYEAASVCGHLDAMYNLALIYLDWEFYNDRRLRLKKRHEALALLKICMEYGHVDADRILKDI